jgi:phytoene desaturase
MDNYPRAVIIGAGVGGLATACFLAGNGYKVDIFEKNALPGGRCGQIIQDGHRFDLGATLLLMPSIYRMVLSELGIDLEKDLEATPLDPAYKLFFSDGSDFSFTRSSEKMREQLESIEQGSFERYQQYISEGYDFFRLAVDNLLGLNFTNLPSFINFRNVKLLINLKSHIKQADYVKKFFRDKRLQMAFTFQNIYVGQNPYDAPAFFSMLPGAELAEGALFPKGGMHRIVEKLSELAIERGVGIYYKKPVSQILTNGRKATGLLLEDGSVENADLIVGNADLPYIYRDLLREKRTTRRLNRKKYSCSAIVFHWGVRKEYPGLEHHSIFLNDPYKQGLDMIFRNKSLGDNPSFYVHAPVRSDKGAAPEGEDTISVIVPVAHLDDHTVQDWKELKQKARESVIRRLKEAGLTDLEEHIKFEICYLPRTWEKSCNVTRGSVFGSLAHTIFQMGYFRPHNRHRKYENLYFAGGSTHPGNGVPLVLMSARLTTARILKESKN